MTYFLTKIIERQVDGAKFKLEAVNLGRHTTYFNWELNVLIRTADSKSVDMLI
jgi:hypothetical protein